MVGTLESNGSPGQARHTMPPTPGADATDATDEFQPRLRGLRPYIEDPAAPEEPRLAQAIGDGLRWEPRPVLETAEALLLGRGDEHAVAHQRSGGVAVEGIEPEDDHVICVGKGKIISLTGLPDQAWLMTDGGELGHLLACGRKGALRI
jgi:hypothetical protein